MSFNYTFLYPALQAFHLKKLSTKADNIHVWTNDGGEGVFNLICYLGWLLIR